MIWAEVLLLFSGVLIGIGLFLASIALAIFIYLGAAN
jgi:hypothetical protein